MFLGKIVKSDSHINYVCQIYSSQEVEEAPHPADYIFGRFVRVPIRRGQPLDHGAKKPVLNPGPESVVYAIGVITDTILVHLTLGNPGPRLTSEGQEGCFSPDFISEKVVLITVMTLGMMEQRLFEDGTSLVLRVTHGVPHLSLDVGSSPETMSEEEIRAFHFFRDADEANQEAYLHLGYLPHLLLQPGRLLPMVALRLLDQLERLFPQNLALLGVIKRNFAWRLQVETTG